MAFCGLPPHFCGPSHGGPGPPVKMNRASRSSSAFIHKIPRKSEQADRSAMQTKRTPTMPNTTKLAGAALVGALALSLATPAAARDDTWSYQLRHQIQQLDRQVDRADRRGDLSRRDVAQLRWHVGRLSHRWEQYSHDGFNRHEVGTMRQMIGNVRRLLANQVRERNLHRERDWRDDRSHGDRYDRDYRSERHDRYDRYDRR